MTPWTVAHQAPLSMGFPKQEYWSSLPFPSPGDLSEPGIEPMSSVLAGTEPLYLPGTIFTTEPPGGDHPMVNNRIPCSWLSLKGITYLLMCTSEPEQIS